MRIAIRADASKSIGTGHVMRQIALAQHLLSQNHEVTLFASVTGPDWLRRYVESQSGLVWLEVKEGDFSADPLLADGAVDALVVDAYTLNQKALQLLEKVIPTVAVIIDGPWQDVSGKLAIAPTLDGNPSWAPEYWKRFEEFHWGPEFVMLRREVIELRKKRFKRSPNSEPQIVVALGGSDQSGKTEQIVEILREVAPEADIHAYVSGVVSSVARKIGKLGMVRVNELGPDFIQQLATADLAVVGAGTTIAEVSFLEVPGIFIVVADNQTGNIESIGKISLGVVFDSREASFGESLKVFVEKMFQNGPSVVCSATLGKSPVDGLGAARVASRVVRI